MVARELLVPCGLTMDTLYLLPFFFFLFSMFNFFFPLPCMAYISLFLLAHLFFSHTPRNTLIILIFSPPPALLFPLQRIQVHLFFVGLI
jgi:hypothetical protein